MLRKRGQGPGKITVLTTRAGILHERANEHGTDTQSRWDLHEVHPAKGDHFAMKQCLLYRSPLRKPMTVSLNSRVWVTKLKCLAL